MEPMIRNALSLMHERYSDNLTLDDMASAAIMSKFHFIRIFREALGVTPCRYLSALRLHEAKRLLRSTRMNVSDISSKVGYSSTGSFTRRFTESVGYSPIQYRNSVVAGAGPRAGLRSAEDGTLDGVVWGSVRTSRDVHDVLVGIFDSPILERAAIASRLLGGPGSFRLSAPVERQFYVHAVAWGAEGTAESGPWHDENGGLLVASSGPFTAGSGAVTRVDLELGPHGWGQPPVLLALPRAPRRRLVRHGVRSAHPIGVLVRPAGESVVLAGGCVEAAVA